MFNNDTIAAPATALVNQAIAIVRVSGDLTHQVINKIIRKPITNFKSTINYRWIYDDQERIDECLIMCYSAPNSFTGEDMIEINCHGGVVVVNRILELLMKHGVRMAERGEFSKRAFLNNKINLAQAEAINDLIHATNISATQLAINNLQRRSYEKLISLRQSLLDVIANVNVNIDYPEYDGVGDLTSEEMLARLKIIIHEFKNIVEISNGAKYINQGINTLILGRPNVGKSSLLNALLNEEKAIVSDIQGTTRDFVEGRVNINNLTLNLIDSAGIRNHAEQIEAIGIEKTLNKIKDVDLCLVVVDGREPLTEEDWKIIKLTENSPRIIVVNKCDVGHIDLQIAEANMCYVSAKNQDLSSLYQLIREMFVKIDLSKQQDAILSSISQISILKTVVKLLEISYNETITGVPVDLVVVNLQDAWNHLGQLLGDVYEETIIDAMFKNYCLGK